MSKPVVLVLNSLRQHILKNGKYYDQGFFQDFVRVGGKGQGFEVVHKWGGQRSYIRWQTMAEGVNAPPPPPPKRNHDD